jgi:hypothetical protein
VRHVALALSLCGPTLTGKRGGWHSLELISFALTGRTFGNQTKQFAARHAADRRAVPRVTPHEDAAIRKACALDGQLHTAATALLKARALLALLSPL